MATLETDVDTGQTTETRGARGSDGDEALMDEEADAALGIMAPPRVCSFMPSCNENSFRFCGARLGCEVSRKIRSKLLEMVCFHSVCGVVVVDLFFVARAQRTS